MDLSSLNINPTIFAWSATIIGTILCEELNELEQNSIGNWLVLLGDYLLTNAAQIAVLEGNQAQNMPTNDQKIDLLMNTLEKIKKELNEIKKDCYKNKS